MEDYMPNAKEMVPRLKAMGAQYNLEFNNITMMPNTNRALQLGEYAKEVGKSMAFNSAMYKATFVDDVEISLMPELKEIAASVGITEAEVIDVFSSDKYVDILEENKIYCQKNKIQSVPTFIINDQYVIVGAQSSDRFKDIFENIKNGTVTF